MDIEQTLSQNLRDIQNKLDIGRETFLFVNEGLKAYEQRKLKDCQLSPNNSMLNKLYDKIRNDKDLRFPHRKILEFLLGQYDFEKNQFREVHFSRLVIEARVGKNMAGSYLSLLEQKGYIEVRNDGYRKWCRVKEGEIRCHTNPCLGR